MPAVSTFSIVARDRASGDLGVAVASKFLAVGAVVPYAEAGVGALATQCHANTSYGPRAMAALRAGVPVGLVQQAFAATDGEHAKRQYGLVDAAGRSVSFTGDACEPWAGGVTRDGVAAQGNLLSGSEVVDALLGTYQAGSGGLAERLLAALAAGDAAGGDRRGRQSAALLVVRAGGGYGGFNDRYVDLRVDDHARPIARLGELLTLHRLHFERPSDHDLLPLQGETRARVLTVLQRAGRLPPGGAWDAAALAALRQLGGVENLEERLVHDDRIDRLALEHLERLYPG